MQAEKLYHGTDKENIRSIEIEGFYGSELSDDTNGFPNPNKGDGVVFLTDNFEEAEEYGDE